MLLRKEKIMERLKGGQYLIDIGEINDEDDITSKIPQELLDTLLIGYNGMSFNELVITRLKNFVIRFKDSNARHIVLSPAISLLDDFSAVELTGISSFDGSEIEINRFSFDFSAQGVIRCVYREFYKQFAE